MISFDTNIALAMVDSAHPAHARGLLFSAQVQERSDVVVSEFMLLEHIPMNEPVLWEALAVNRNLPT